MGLFSANSSTQVFPFFEVPSMFGIGMNELLLVLALALIIIGPKKLPEIAKALGRGLAEFKRATDEFKNTIAEESRVTETRDQLLRDGKIRAPGADTTSSEAAASPADAEDAVEDAAEKTAGAAASETAETSPAKPASEGETVPADAKAQESSHDG
jgi:Tat protein translocase TatB subunit